MLHAEFQNNRPSGSGEDFLKFLLFIAMVRPKKKICLFPVTSPNFFGSVGRKTFLFYSFFFF